MNEWMKEKKILNEIIGRWFIRNEFFKNLKSRRILGI